MGRVYGEPVEVQTREDGRPARFVWRGRLYAVRSIMEHWVVNREWWRETDPVPGQPELEFWRVEASAGQGCRRAPTSCAGTWRPVPGRCAGSWIDA